jgi:hypothetical protein
LDAGPLWISEFMASNTRTLADQDGQFSDWIEIHNPTQSAVALDGWCLTDSAANLTKWRFPDITANPDVVLPAGGYLVVFASSNDRRIDPGTGGPAAEFHTNFKLDAAGEYLALVQADGVTIASSYAPKFADQFADISYGWSQDLQTQGYFTVPSPRAAPQSPPVASLVVINEIMYHPGWGEPGGLGYVPENTGHEFVELWNKSTGSVSLKDWTLDRWWFAAQTARTVSSVTREDWTATVTLASHGYVNGDTILMSGATETAFNGVFTIGGVTANTFSYTLPSLPTATASGTILAQKASQRFPDVTLAAGAYLVVAGDGTAFHAKYPTVSNYVAAWTPRLSNSGEELVLRNSLGVEVSKVAYANQGEWAARSRGELPVSLITLSSTTATVTLPYHGFTSGDTIRIAGADQAAYNGEFTIGSVTRDSFTYTVTGSPASPATGAITAQRKDYGHYGWEWYSAADGRGKSLELINATLPVNRGQNWGASLPDGGTPGTLNSIVAADIAPLIDQVTHFPVIPNANQQVTVTARVMDEALTPPTVTLHYRVNARQVTSLVSAAGVATATLAGHGWVVGDSVRITGADQTAYNGVFTITAITTDTFQYAVSGGPATPATGAQIMAGKENAAFAQVAMFDDGQHVDGAAGDRVFGASLPGQPNLAIV